MRFRWLIIVLAAAGAVAAQRRFDAMRGTYQRQEEALYWSPAQVKRLSDGFQQVAADLYWLRTVQYFGGQRVYATNKRFDLLSPLVQTTVTLDPRFELAYRYGAIFLAEPWPIGAGETDDAIALLRQGVGVMPSATSLWQDLGLFHFFFKKDPKAASEVLLEGSRHPGTAPWLSALAGAVLVRGGERQAARLIWQRIHDEAPPGQMRENAAIHLALIDAQDRMAVVQDDVRAFASAHGRNPASLAELAASGAHAPIVDQAGVPFSYDPVKGTVSLARKSPIWRNY